MMSEKYLALIFDDFGSCHKNNFSAFITSVFAVSALMKETDKSIHEFGGTHYVFTDSVSYTNDKCL